MAYFALFFFSIKTLSSTSARCAFNVHYFDNLFHFIDLAQYFNQNCYSKLMDSFYHFDYVIIIIIPILCWLDIVWVTCCFIKNGKNNIIILKTHTRLKLYLNRMIVVSTFLGTQLVRKDMKQSPHSTTDERM